MPNCASFFIFFFLKRLYTCFDLMKSFLLNFWGTCPHVLPRVPRGVDSVCSAPLYDWTRNMPYSLLRSQAGTRPTRPMPAPWFVITSASFQINNSFFVQSKKSLLQGWIENSWCSSWMTEKRFCRAGMPASAGNLALVSHFTGSPKRRLSLYSSLIA